MRSMQSIISRGDAARAPQTLSHEWYGKEIVPAVEYSFSIEGEYLVFRAAQAAQAQPHPEGKPGEFKEELWKYDTAEFFIADAEGKLYMEFNLSPAGAWWACVFSAPRVAAPEYGVPQGVQTTGSLSAEGWACSARIPLEYLSALGITPERCRLAATCILNSPDYVFLTSAEDLSGEPDFHRPHSWPAALCH